MSATVVLIGDSIRMGYEQTVRERLEGRVTIWSPPENGGNSRNVLAHLEAWVESCPPTLVHLNGGLHDLRREFGVASNAVPLGEYEENLRTIIKRILDSGAHLIWATTTPVNQERHHAVKEFDRFEADVETYNAAAACVVATRSLPVDDLYTLVMAHGRDELLLSDGVHYTVEGYRLLGSQVAQSIGAALG